MPSVYAAVFASLIIVLLGSCASLPKGAEVNPIDLLSGDASFYMRIPKKTDGELVERILRASAQHISESDAKLISGRIDTIYAAISRAKTSFSVEAAVSGNIPRRTAQALLLKSAQWKTETHIPERSIRPYFYYAANGVSLAFPSPSIVCAANDVRPMLSSFDAHAYGGSISHNVSDAVYDWLNVSGSEIRFYAPNPLSFLTILTGTNLNLQLNYVKGAMTVDSAHEDQYFMSIEFDFNNKNIVRAGEAMLALAFGLTNAQTTRNSPTNITVSGIRINKRQLYKLFVL